MTLFLYLILGIDITILIFVILLGWRQWAVKREIFDPWDRTLEAQDGKLYDFYCLVARTANRDFTPFRHLPWTWFRYRNLLRARKLL